MITLSFSLWEVAVLIVAIAVIIGTVYLVKLFKSIANTLELTTKLMEDNRSSLANILNNTEEITKSTANITDKTNKMVNEVEQSIDMVKKDFIQPLIKNMASISKLINNNPFTHFKKRKKQNEK
jgi:uncharacterized protein YoxC